MRILRPQEKGMFLSRIMRRTFCQCCDSIYNSHEVARGCEISLCKLSLLRFSIQLNDASCVMSNTMAARGCNHHTKHEVTFSPSIYGDATFRFVVFTPGHWPPHSSCLMSDGTILCQMIYIVNLVRLTVQVHWAMRHAPCGTWYYCRNSNHWTVYSSGRVQYGIETLFRRFFSHNRTTKH